MPRGISPSLSTALTRWVALGDITVNRVDVPGDVRHEGVQGKMGQAEARDKGAKVERFNRTAKKDLIRHLDSM